MAYLSAMIQIFKDDLNDKLTKLETLIELPETFIEDYCQKLKQEIDLASEERLIEAKEYEDEIQSINEHRIIMIDKVNTVRGELYKKLDETYRESTVKSSLIKAYADLKSSALDAFGPVDCLNKENSDENDECYVSLASKIQDAIDQCRKTILCGQSLMFLKDIPRNNPIGCLVVLKDYFPTELEASYIW